MLHDSPHSQSEYTTPTHAGNSSSSPALGGYPRADRRRPISSRVLAIKVNHATAPTDKKCAL